MSSATEQTSHGPESTAGAFERLIIVTDDMNDDLKCITTQDRDDACKIPIATIETGWTGPIEGEQERYLKLFAAATDLLEALRYAHRNGIDETFWQMALAATQKAEGR